MEHNIRRKQIAAILARPFNREPAMFRFEDDSAVQRVQLKTVDRRPPEESKQEETEVVHES